MSVEDFEANDIKIYPNPVSDALNVYLNTSIKTIEIYSVQGKKLITMNETSTIDVSRLSKGLYLVKIYAMDKVQSTLRFIKN